MIITYFFFFATQVILICFVKSSLNIRIVLNYIDFYLFIYIFFTSIRDFYQPNRWISTYNPRKTFQHRFSLSDSVSTALSPLFLQDSIRVCR